MFSCHPPDGIIYDFCSPNQLIEFFVLLPNFQISQAWLETYDSLILFYLGQFFLQIPYLIFEFFDHFSSRSATLTLGRRQAPGNISVWECILITIGHYPEPSKTKILLPPTAKAGTQFFQPDLDSGFHRNVERFLEGRKGHPQETRCPFLIRLDPKLNNLDVLGIRSFGCFFGFEAHALAFR